MTAYSSLCRALVRREALVSSWMRQALISVSSSECSHGTSPSATPESTVPLLWGGGVSNVQCNSPAVHVCTWRRCCTSCCHLDCTPRGSHKGHCKQSNHRKLILLLTFHSSRVLFQCTALCSTPGCSVGTGYMGLEPGPLKPGAK